MKILPVRWSVHMAAEWPTIGQTSSTSSLVDGVPCAALGWCTRDGYHAAASILSCTRDLSFFHWLLYMSILKQFGIVLSPPSTPHQSATSPQLTPAVSGSMDVFLDGSAIGNGKKSVKAGYAAVFPDHPALTLHEHLPWNAGVPPSNNRAEYMALIRAHEVAPPGQPLNAYTDSMLLVKTVTQWLPMWKRKGWMKADGQPVLNLDLVQRLDTLKRERPLTIHHVRAHTGKQDYHSIWNAKADELAKKAAHIKS